MTTTTNEKNSAATSDGDSVSALEKLRALLSVRDHTDFEVRSKLSSRYSSDEISEALAFAHARGWLQSAEEQSARVAAKLAGKNKGIAFINETLESRGLPPLTIDASSEIAKAQKLLDSKLARNPSFDYESKKKFYRLLASRGFDEETISTVLRSAGFADADDF